MRKIGIMGGTFDPIHLAHLAMAKCAKEQKELDQIWFMPSKIPPHKREKKISSEEVRSILVKLAIQNEKDFIFSDFELLREEITYTARTLELLQKQFPEDLFYFILGGDSLFQFEHWYQPEKIMEKAVILAAGRDGVTKRELQKQADMLSQKFHGKVELFDMPEMKISSSQIREKIAHGEPVASYLPDKVYEYIMSHHCYQ
ncbi:MAG: nicotinate-nucleotide adenylyltransferase [Butyribacter sp.]|nr:nicotinate-nucleotide adenylyltransferase [bacterium]MDY3853861.1 nicotinate-nucleotide adenylyltransferase [Butyribacter sp.]